MSKKRFKDDIVYSTEEGFTEEITDSKEIQSIPNEEQRLKLSIDKSGRKGKTVTLIQNFIGPKTELDNLARLLKTFCGVGGTTKDTTIEIQGDFRNKIREKLISLGFKVTS